MSVLGDLLDRLAPPPRDPDPLAGYSEAERAAIVQGRPLPRPRRRYVQPAGPSIVAGRSGLSDWACHLFEAAQKAGGSIELRAFARSTRPPTHIDSVRRFADELEHFGCAARERGDVLRVAAGFEDVVLLPSYWLSKA